MWTEETLLRTKAFKRTHEKASGRGTSARIGAGSVIPHLGSRACRPPSRNGKGAWLRDLLGPACGPVRASEATEYHRFTCDNGHYHRRSHREFAGLREPSSCPCGSCRASATAASSDRANRPSPRSRSRRVSLDRASALQFPRAGQERLGVSEVLDRQPGASTAAPQADERARPQLALVPGGLHLGIVQDVVDARVGSLQEHVCPAGHFLLPMDQDAAIELADITEVGDLERKPWVGNQDTVRGEGPLAVVGLLKRLESAGEILADSPLAIGCRLREAEGRKKPQALCEASATCAGRRTPACVGEPEDEVSRTVRIRCVVAARPRQDAVQGCVAVLGDLPCECVRRVEVRSGSRAGTCTGPPHALGPAP